MAEKKSAPEVVAVTEETAAPAGDVIAYVGSSNWRAIYEADWANVDVKGTDHLWSDENDHEIAVSEFNVDEAEWLLADVDDFILRPATVKVAPVLDFIPDPAQHA